MCDNTKEIGVSGEGALVDESLVDFSLVYIFLLYFLSCIFSLLYTGSPLEVR